MLRNTCFVHIKMFCKKYDGHVAGVSSAFCQIPRQGKIEKNKKIERMILSLILNKIIHEKSVRQ